MINQFHYQKLEDLFSLFETNLTGLTEEEVIKRRKKYGFNILPDSGKKSKILIFLKQFNSVFVYVLFLAAIISLFLNKFLDFYVILVIILFNVFLGFFYENKAENAIEALKGILKPKVKVIRNNQLKVVSVEELVPGDIVYLEKGDKVPADCRLIEENNLTVDESLLTGESFPVEKEVKNLPISTPLAERKNMLFMGTFVVGGEAKAMVVLTGDKTFIGSIALTLKEIKDEKTHFDYIIKNLFIKIGLIALLGSLTVFSFGYFIRKFDFFEILLFSIASLVSAVPEGLPAILTIILAIGASLMAKRNVLVRDLKAIDALGVCNIIATDKTGTLTENAMTVKRIVLFENEIEVSGEGWHDKGSFFINKNVIDPLSKNNLDKLIHIAALCNKSKIYKKEDGNFEIFGDPTELALLFLVRKAGLDENILLKEEKIVYELPFDEHRKYRAILIDKENHREIFYIGAFEQIFKNCQFYLDEKGNIKKIKNSEYQRLLEKIDELAFNAMRVLAIAYKEEKKLKDDIKEDDFRDLVFVGFVGMIDPPKKEVKEAIKKAHQAGIRVIMKTGDHKKTALAIAREIGLVNKEEEKVFTESELLEMSEKEFEEAVLSVNIFARLTPKMKMKIVETLQQKNFVVAMTGDGVNDAPALKKANIGISMGKIGTDVAREASDLILLDDNFASIISAIEEGRVVFNNIRRTAFFLFTTNLAEQLTILTTLILKLPLPILPIQILYLNLVTDGLVGTGLAFEKKHGHELLQKPRNKKEPILNKEILPFLFLTVILMNVLVLFFFNYYLKISNLEKARTIAFLFLSFLQVFNALNLKSITNSIFKVGLFNNPYLVFGFILSVIIQILVIKIEFLRNLLHFYPLNFKEIFLVFVLSSFILWIGEFYKLIKNKK